MMRTQPVLRVCLVAALCLLATTASAVTQYTLTDLGIGDFRLPNGDALNDLGQVVGSIYVAGHRHPFLWQNGVLTDLLPEGGLEADAYAINNLGEVVGTANVPGLGGPAFVWLPEPNYGLSAGMNGLGTLGGVWSEAWSINNAGQIAGVANTASGAIAAFLWQDGTMIRIGPETLKSIANSINDAGWVVGHAWVEGIPDRAFLRYPDGNTIFLGEGNAVSLNEAGQILFNGSSGFIWQGGVLTSLGTLGGDIAWGYDINEAGQVVGTSGTGTTPETHAFIWEDGAMHDLNDLLLDNEGLVLVHGNAINASGQILGVAVDPVGHRYAVLLTPIPEPSVLALAALGVLGLPFSARLRRMKVLRRRRSINCA